MAFKDLFSGHAGDYARFRPTYPPELFAWLATLPPDRDVAVDVATGNGQAAVGLAPHFAQVIGLDASAAQLAAADKRDNVRYECAPAEATGLPSGCASLVTAAQAFHWFRATDFFAEAARVLKPSGVLAFWCYGLARIEPAVDAAVYRFYEDIIGPYWEPERRLVENGYRDVAVPLPELPAPAFEIRLDWSLGDLVGYLRTWSALKAYVRDRGRDPLDDIEAELLAAWGSVERRPVSWPLSVRAFHR